MKPLYNDVMAYGSLHDGVMPVLIDAPTGARVKLRFHQCDIAKAFIRHKNGTFSAWSLEWVNPEARTLKLAHPIANTVRQRA